MANLIFNFSTFQAFPVNFSTEIQIDFSFIRQTNEPTGAKLIFDEDSWSTKTQCDVNKKIGRVVATDKKHAFDLIKAALA